MVLGEEEEEDGQGKDTVDTVDMVGTVGMVGMVKEGLLEVDMVQVAERETGEAEAEAEEAEEEVAGGDMGGEEDTGMVRIRELLDTACLNERAWCAAAVVRESRRERGLAGRQLANEKKEPTMYAYEDM